MDTAATLAWMRDNASILREMVAEETDAPGEGEAPADDASIRAHLRFLAAALEATADPAWAEPLAGFTGDLPGWFAESQHLFDHHLAHGEGAMALEAHLQWGTRPGVDPSIDIAQERRIRLFGWMRLFLLGLETHLGHSADGLADQVLSWFDARQRDLGRMVVALDLQAQMAAREAAGGTVDTDTVDQLGQAVLVQAFTRHLAEGLCAALNEVSAGSPGPEAGAGG